MALALGIHEGDKLYLDDEEVHVVLLKGHEHAILKCGPAFYTITDKESVEVYPGVFISMGRPRERVYKSSGDPRPNESVLARLLIEAPREIKILRESLYALRKAGLYDTFASAAPG